MIRIKIERGSKPAPYGDVRDWFAREKNKARYTGDKTVGRICELAIIEITDMVNKHGPYCKVAPTQDKDENLDVWERQWLDLQSVVIYHKGDDKIILKGCMCDGESILSQQDMLCILEKKNAIITGYSIGMGEDIVMPVKSIIFAYVPRSNMSLAEFVQRRVRDYLTFDYAEGKDA